MFDIGANGRFDIHTKEFAKQAASDEAHLATLRCAKALAMVGLEYVFDESIREKVRREFKGTQTVE